MSGGVAGIDHVQLAAPPGCEEEARGFFGGVLGLEEIPKPESLRARGGVWFRCGDQELHLGVEEGFAPARKAHPALSVRGLEDLRTRLVGAGVDAVDDDSIPHLRRVYAHDPFGNRLEFVEDIRLDELQAESQSGARLQSGFGVPSKVGAVDGTEEVPE